MRPVPSLPTGAAARLPRSVPSVVAAAVLAALALVAMMLVVREYTHPYQSTAVLLEVPSVPAALLAAGAMLVRHQMVRLLLVAGAVGAMAAASLYAAPVSIGFISDAAYAVPAALGWMTVIIMIAGFVAAWRESGFALQWAVLAAAAGGVAGVIAAWFIFYVLVVISLVMHAWTF